eukprot:scaffold153924_cov37-Tisochrysis_lutea.AAC.2
MREASASASRCCVRSSLVRFRRADVMWPLQSNSTIKAPSSAAMVYNWFGEAIGCSDEVISTLSMLLVSWSERSSTSAIEPPGISD